MSDEDIEFVREAGAKLRELSQRYRAALREMVVRFEILDQDLNLRKDRTPIHHVESRVKTPESIIEKIGRYGKERTLENIEKYIMDIAGIRVICSYISDVYNLFDLLQRQDDLEIVTVKDYIANPKPNGYRQLACDRPHSRVLPRFQADGAGRDSAAHRRHGLLGKSRARPEVQGEARDRGHRFLR